MKLNEIMSKTPVTIDRNASVLVAARLLSYYNIGALPVQNQKGEMCGILTDRDIVMRCIAVGKAPEKMIVDQIMTRRVVTASSNMEAESAARLMCTEQIRRLPVVEEGKLCGMVSVADLINMESLNDEAVQQLRGISANVRHT